MHAGLFGFQGVLLLDTGVLGGAVADVVEKLGGVVSDLFNES